MKFSLLCCFFRRKKQPDRTIPEGYDETEPLLPDGRPAIVDDPPPLRSVLYWHLSIEPPSWLHNCDSNHCRLCDFNHHFWLLIIRHHLDCFRDIVELQNTSEWEYEQSMVTPWGEMTPEDAHYPLWRALLDVWRFDIEETDWREAAAMNAMRLLEGRSVSSRTYEGFPTWSPFGRREWV